MGPTLLIAAACTGATVAAKSGDTAANAHDTGSDTADTTDSAADSSEGDAIPLTFASADLADGATFPEENTCAGADRQPELHWSGVPNGTASLAITLVDESIDYVHWVAYDVPPGTTALVAGASDDDALPTGSKEAKAYGTQYRGPCPQADPHTYTFTLWALNAASVDFTGKNPLAARDLNRNFGDATLATASFSGESDASPN